MACSAVPNHANGGKRRFLVNDPSLDLPRKARLGGEDDGCLHGIQCRACTAIASDEQCRYIDYILRDKSVCWRQCFPIHLVPTEGERRYACKRATRENWCAAD